MPRLEEIQDPLKTLLAGLPCPTFATTPAAAGVPLEHRKVAIISTAGLHLRGAPPFLGISAEYRELPSSVHPGDIVMSHVSPNFDRSGFHLDWNVGFPIDRLKELVEEGLVGAVAETHYSFMGATDPTLMEPRARTVARRLRAKGVDAALLVPVWPFCTRAVGGLGHYLEQEGIATTQISLVREHTETIRPPRALYVPFEFGRPLGAPDDVAGQRQVMLAALRLLERNDVPVLEEYTVAPRAEGATAPGPEALDGLACMLHSHAETNELKQAVRTEITRLRPLYDAVVATRGDLPIGVLGLPAEELVEFVLSFLDGPGQDSPRPEVPTPHALKIAVDDLAAFYNVAASRCASSSASLSPWFWHKTALGKAIQTVRNCLVASDKAVLKAVAYLLMTPMLQTAERPEIPRILESYGRLMPLAGVAAAAGKSD